MARPDRLSSLLPVTVLAASLGMSAADAPAGPQTSRDPITVEFDSMGRLTRLDPALLSALGIDPSGQTPPTWDEVTLPDPVPLGENKINAMCVCRRPGGK